MESCFSLSNKLLTHMLLTVNRDSAAIINVNISDPSYQKKKSLKEVVTATVNTKSTHQCEFCRTIVSNN